MYIKANDLEQVLFRLMQSTVIRFRHEIRWLSNAIMYYCESG
jgi:transcription initiation factor IIE alpha subunit